MTTIRHAPIELAELACKMRDDWDRAETDGAIRAAGLAGWTWEQTAQTAIRLACIPDQYPRDLVEACRKPLEHRPVLAPDQTAAHADHARRMIAEARSAASGEAGAA